MTSLGLTIPADTTQGLHGRWNQGGTLPPRIYYSVQNTSEHRVYLFQGGDVNDAPAAPSNLAYWQYLEPGAVAEVMFNGVAIWVRGPDGEETTLAAAPSTRPLRYL